MGFPAISVWWSNQDKGHTEQFRLLIERLKSGGEALIPYEEIINTTRASFAAIESMKKGSWVDVKEGLAAD